MSHVDGVDDGVGYGVSGKSSSGAGLYGSSEKGGDVLGGSRDGFDVVGMSGNSAGLYIISYILWSSQSFPCSFVH